uniref:TASOR pseudo-PARP domain-containing protein n=1 Tax=Anolis carolinensis TaxID=28377 RepID=H9G769_ANOCA
EAFASPLRNFNLTKLTIFILTECFANKREYDEVKQCLIQGCLAKDNNFERWPIEKIEMLQNKHLEEEFVMKRSRLRQERKPDKELPCFLVVAKDDVSKICQSGLHIGQNLKIMDELGNRHLGVYLFRHVDIALKYAAIHSSHIENVIIFRVSESKIPMGLKRAVMKPLLKKPSLDPTHLHNFWRVSNLPFLDKVLERMLVYVYEYNELAKPVDRPRQCLPYAVVKIKCVNLKMHAGFTLTPSKSRPKGLPKRVERDLPLENCTRVTRIGKNQLIYEHFRKPYTEDLENCSPAESCPFSGRIQNWNGSSSETQHRKAKHNFSTRWDIAVNELTIQKTSGMDACIDIRSDHIENEKSLEMPIRVPPESGFSIVTTSKSIKDPRLVKRQQN